MNLLAIETSSSVLSVALQKGSGPVIEKSVEGAFSHLENLMPAIDQLLKKRKLSIQKVDAFLIGRGPGSFTGLRIGFGTLKGFLAIQKKDCFGALSLDMIAENVTRDMSFPNVIPGLTPACPAGRRNPDVGSRLGGQDDRRCDRLCVCLDARREKIYSRFYVRNKNHWAAGGKPEVLNCGEFVNRLADGDALCGDALIRYESEIRRLAPDKNIIFLDKTFWNPRASTMISWFSAGEHFKKSKSRLKFLKNTFDFLPLYFRLSEAEEKRKENALHVKP